jgi:hypothetical protein
LRFIIITAAILSGAVSSHASAQVAARRAATASALLTYSGFYQGQLVIVRGTLATRDQPVLLSPSIDRSIPLIFKGPSPIDGPVEVRATFWDVGRLQREDPRVPSMGLDRLLPRSPEADWPRPGEVIALVVTDAMSVKTNDGEPTLRQIALDPSPHIGKRVRIKGQFRGRNLYGDLPQGPGLSQWDYVLRAADATVWVTGLRPRGRGFNLSTSARVDTSAWLEVAGVVREGKGLIWIEGQQVALTKPDLETRNAETPPLPEMGPPPEVIFADPADADIDVALTQAIRLQFSRDMNPDSFKGNVRWSFVGGEGAGAGGAPASERHPEVKYDRAKRALEVKLDLKQGAAYRTVAIELLDGIAATDGAKLLPWKLTFSFGGP